MKRWPRIAVAALVLLVIAGALYFPALRRRITQLGRAQRTEEQARREVVQPPIITPTDVKVLAKLFLLSASEPGKLAPVEFELPLSADPVLRAKQLLGVLISAPAAAERTLPADAALLEFYLLPDGTAIADFSDTITSGTPSGILSEQLAVDSIVGTLAAGVPQIRRVKILVHGQEVDTLAGHYDLTVFFPGNPPPAPVAGPPAPPAAPASGPSSSNPVKTSGAPEPGKAPAAPPPAKSPGKLTPPSAPGKLGR